VRSQYLAAFITAFLLPVSVQAQEVEAIGTGETGAYWTEGVWKTTFGKVLIKDEIASGTIEYLSMTTNFDGKVDGNTLIGTYDWRDNSDGRANSGTFRWELVSSRKFEGEWTMVQWRVHPTDKYQLAPPNTKGPWNGDFVEEQPRIWFTQEADIRFVREMPSLDQGYEVLDILPYFVPIYVELEITGVAGQNTHTVEVRTSGTTITLSTQETEPGIFRSIKPFWLEPDGQQPVVQP